MTSQTADLVARLLEHANECEGVAKEREQAENLHHMNTCDYAYAMAFRSAADEIERLRKQITQSCDDARSDPEHGGCPIVLQAQHERDCAVEDVKRLELLAKFGAWCFESHRGDMNEPGDIDGGSVQDELVRLGLLEAREMTAPCGPQCICGPSEQNPETCYFTAPGLRDLIGTLTRNGE